MKKLLLTLLKVGISLAIIAYLVWKSTRGAGDTNVFANLCDQPKRWNVLAAAWACCTAAVLLTFVRWWYLALTLDIPLRLRDSIRISFWGYLLNFLPLGIVGGDLIKVVMLAHEHPEYRAKGLASVLFDRVIGLYWLFVVASAAIWCTDLWHSPEANIRRICHATFLATLVGTIGLIFVLGPDMTEGRIIRAIGRIPRIGRPLESLINAIRMYASKPGALLITSVMTIGVHSLFAFGCYLIACGLPGGTLSLGMYFVIMPLGSAAGVLPVPMGPLEWVLDTLYAIVPSQAAILKGQGLVVALTYRLITALIAALGMPYYFGNRREMAEVMHEAEEEQQPV